jgi:hypothetical protein
MKRILVLVVALGLFACSKDKFKTEPQVEIKSFGPDNVTLGQLFTLRAIVRDKEGDTNDSVLLVRKLQTNTSIRVDTLRRSVASFGAPEKSTIEIQAITSYGRLLDNYLYVDAQTADRTIAYGVIVIDKAKHRSAYVESPTIILKKF